MLILYFSVPWIPTEFYRTHRQYHCARRPGSHVHVLRPESWRLQGKCDFYFISLLKNYFNAILLLGNILKRDVFGLITGKIRLLFRKNHKI